MDETTRKFQVTVRVESDEELNDDQWDEVADNLADAIHEGVELDSLYIERWCGECDAQEDVTAYLTVDSAQVVIPDRRRPGVIGLPR
jgi:hypothetical protein